MSRIRFLWILPALLPFSLSANDNPVETLIVSGNRAHAVSGRIPAAVTVIDREAIRESGASRITEVLRSTGVITVSDLYGDGTESSVGLRGFSETAQHNTLIMIDGRRLNNIDNGLPDLNTIPLRSIDRIEIVHGSQGALFGDKAVGGTINIITRDPESPAVRGRLQYGSYNRRAFQAGLENRHDNGIQYRISGLRSLNDNYRDRNTSHVTDITAMLGWKHAAGKMAVEYQDVNEDIQLPGALFSDMLVEDRRQALNQGDYTDTDTRLLRISLEQTLTDWLTGYFEYTNRLSDTDGRISSGGSPSGFTLDRHHIEFTPRLAAQFGMPSGDVVLTLGADIFRTDYRIVSDFGLTDDEQDQESVYLHGIVPLHESLDLTLGARHSRVRNDILVDTLAFGRSLPEGSEIDDSANAYEAGLSFRPADSWRLFGRLARNFRFVSADEYSAVADNNFFANLFAAGTVVTLPRTQTGYSYELGAEWTGGKAFARALVYQLDLDDEIVFDPSLFLNTNIGDTRRRGVMLEGRHAFGDKWRVSASYSFVDAKVTSGPFSGSDLTFIAAHTASISGRYRHNENLSAYLEITGTGSRDFGGDFANTFPELSGHVIANLNLDYQTGPFGFSFRINNLLGTDYSDAGNIAFDFRQPFPSPQVRTFFPAPGRNFLLTVEYDYQ